MKRSFKYLFAVLLLTVGVANANDKTLSAAEIKDLLTGNTAVGEWLGSKYRQFFDDDGSTIYAQENTRSSLGQWRVSFSKNHYESWWERVGWGEGFSIVVKDDVYYWVSSAGNTEPQAFEVVSGSQLIFKE